ncbi:MAG: hypothetical protein ACC662_07870, partial [Planctomycetota bacterium]
MRTTLFFVVLVVAMGAGLGIPNPEARAGDPNSPGPYEVILHGDNFFGAGLAKRFRVEPTMRQRVVYLQGQLLAQNFRSVQVGSKVVATLYRSRPGRLDAGYDRTQLLHSTTSLQPVYAILVVNRKSDGRLDSGEYLDLPFRVTVAAEWSGGISGGHLHLDEYFVSQSIQQLNMHDLSPVLQPEDQGADWLSLFSGRYPPGSVEVMFFDELQCRGTNARTFPATPSKDTSYNFWNYGFGDKARSLRITWKGPKFGPAVVPPPPATLAVPDVTGWWKNQLGQRYVFGTNGKKFACKFPALNQAGEGRFLDPTHL